MGEFSERLARIVGGAVALGLGVGLAVVAPPATPALAATATIVKENQWSTGYVGRVTIHNGAPTALTSWRVEFQLPAGTTIVNSWPSVAVIRDGNWYVFTSLPWNGDLAPGASTSFGFLASGTGTPGSCTVNSAPCTGTPVAPDVDPPSVPANAGFTPTWAIVWDPSTDDSGVVAYEVFSRSTRLVATTGTSYQLGGRPSTDSTYGIRAVDAAGNVSAFAVVRIGAGDLSPPTAPTNLRISSPNQGHLPVSWDASRDDVFVAGYEVHLNDVLVHTVGGTSSYVPYRGYGTYFVGVRAFDTMGRYSPMTRIGLAIDPPAPTPPPVTP